MGVMRGWSLAGMVGLSLWAAPGCVIIADADGHWGSHVWRESTEELRLESAALTQLEVRSHNGDVRFDGDQTASGVQVIAKKRGGGRTIEAAEEALAAIEVYTEEMGHGVQRISWCWATDKYSGWQGSVSFSITAPASLPLKVETHNGEIAVEGATSAVAVLTHNGAISVDSSGPKLKAESHNGAIEAEFGGEDVTIISHNGEIDLELTRSGTVGGAISTNNGGVEVAIVEGLASALDCTTNNGTVKVNVPNQSTEINNRHVKAEVGGGGPPLAISTNNGSIRIRPRSG